MVEIANEGKGVSIADRAQALAGVRNRQQIDFWTRSVRLRTRVIANTAMRLPTSASMPPR